MNTKQVIVVRKDLNMSIGKIASQVAHAAMAPFTKGLVIEPAVFIGERSVFLTKGQLNCSWSTAKAVQEWIDNSFAKIVVGVDTLDHYLEVLAKCSEKKVLFFEIIDNGKTEFHGVPTRTCFSVGPDYNEIIDEITGDLRLL